MKKKILFILILLCSLNSVFAIPIDLSQSPSHLYLSRSLEIWEDTSANKTVEQAVKLYQKGKFTPSKETGISFGFTDSAYWAAFTLQNSSQNKTTWFLELDNALMDSFSLFQQNSNGEWEEKKFGDLIPFAQREIEHRNFISEIKLKQQESKLFLLRFQTKGTLKFTLNLWQPDAFQQHLVQETLGFGAYFGLIISLIIYNLFLFSSLKDKSYLYYSLYLVSFCIASFSVLGYAFQYLWSENIFLANETAPFCFGWSHVWLILFIRKFFPLQEHYPRISKVSLIYALFLACSSLIPFSIYPSWFKFFINFLIFINLLMFLLVGFVFYYLGYRQARFYLLGFTVFLIMGIIASLVARGSMNDIGGIQAYWFWASAFEILLFSLALADKINILRTEKEQSQKLLLQTQENYTHTLEETVTQRTTALNKAMARLTHLDQEKSNFLRIAAHDLKTPLANVDTLGHLLRNKIDGKDKQAKEYLHLIRQSAQNMGSLVGNFLNVEKIESQVDRPNLVSLDLNKATQEVIDQFSVQVELKSICFQVDKNGSHFILAQSEWLKEVLFNLISNAIQVSPENGKIFISTVEEAEIISWKIQDQGKGIEKQAEAYLFQKYASFKERPNSNPQSTGLGLYIVKTLLEKMNANVSYCGKDGEGAAFEIRFIKDNLEV